MKVLLTTLNSKFIHSSLSIRYLKSFCQDIKDDIDIAEYTINQSIEYISGEIYKGKYDVVAFACYIWNLENTLEIANKLKIVNPDIKIVLGGPEVSFDSKDILQKYPYVDFIVYGEGEETFKELLLGLIEDQNDYDNITGLTYIDDGQICQTLPRPLIANLDSIPSPYDNNLEAFKNKIVYYESSRGCPFNCQFCLSSTIKGMRFFSLERVKDDLKKLIDAGVKQVKFVDRTFNARKEYALEIMKFIISQNVRDINFHFEVTAHLLDEETLQFLEKVPEGLFQFEIGVQSTNADTLRAIERKTNFQKLSEVVRRIKGYENIHQHLDLIAGLPYEDYNSFKQSFNDVYSLKPDKLQLGFLKLLKGSGLRMNKEKYGFKFLDKPTYEVLENDYIKYDEILKLKSIEDLVEKYGNESNFSFTVEYIISNYFESPFNFFEEFSSYWENNEYHTVSHSKKNLYRIIYDFYKEKTQVNIDIFNEMVKFDYLNNNKNSNLPEYITRYDTERITSDRHDFLQNQDNLKKYLPEYVDLPTKKLIKEVHFEKFLFNIDKFIKSRFDTNIITEQTMGRSVLLFKYSDNPLAFKNCRVLDVTDEFNELE